VGDPVSLDPAGAADDLSLRITREIFSNLVRFRPGTSDIEPGIARAWRVSADGKTWTFRLAPGLRFSDGTRLDAAAVKFNVDRWQAAHTSAFAGTIGALASTAAPDPRTLRFTLRAPIAGFPLDLALPQFGIGSPAAITRSSGDFAGEPVGGGPYEVLAWVRGEYVLLGANPFWDGPKPAYADVYVRDIPDPPTTLLAMKKFDIDILADPRPEDVAELERTPGVRLYRVPGNGAVAFAAKDSIDGIVASPDGSFNFSSMKPRAGS
jgi:peptide/nickel transport system substrate-binding protein